MAFYGFSFGVELTVDNNLAPYIQSQFNKSLLAAGNYAAIFGLLNFFSRPGGADTAVHCMCFLHCAVAHMHCWRCAGHSLWNPQLA